MVGDFCGCHSALALLMLFSSGSHDSLSTISMGTWHLCEGSKNTFHILVYRIRSPDFRFHVSDFRFMIADSRFQTSYFRSQKPQWETGRAARSTSGGVGWGGVGK